MATEGAGMKSVRVFLRTDADRQAIDACRDATGESTAAKAMMVAAASYPSLRRRVAQAESELADLRKLKADILRGLGLD